MALLKRYTILDLNTKQKALVTAATFSDACLKVGWFAEHCVAKAIDYSPNHPLPDTKSK